MNTLSWLLYAAEVSENLRDTLLLFGLVGGVAGTGIGAAMRSGGNEEERETGANIHKWTVRICPALIVLAAILPSQSTVYAIAASEMGEKALNTETAGKAFRALDAWLDKQIEQGDEK